MMAVTRAKSNKAPVVKAILFSRFAETFLVPKVEQLRQHGITVTRIANPGRDKPVAGNKYHLAIIMAEMMSGMDQEKVVKFADQAGIPCIRLTRYTSKWAEQFTPIIRKITEGAVERVQWQKEPEVYLTKGIRPTPRLVPPPPPSEPEPPSAHDIQTPDAILEPQEAAPSSPALPTSGLYPVALPAAPPSEPTLTEPAPEEEKALERQLYEEENARLVALVAKLEAEAAGLRVEVAQYRKAADALHGLTMLRDFLLATPSPDRPR